jgi:hypothetical protein
MTTADAADAARHTAEKAAAPKRVFREPRIPDSPVPSDMGSTRLFVRATRG